jgi:hypothetical protein
MTGGGTTHHMNVDGSKRISEKAVAFDGPKGSFVQETRIRSQSKSVLKSW